MLSIIAVLEFTRRLLTISAVCFTSSRPSSTLSPQLLTFDSIRLIISPCKHSNCYQPPAPCSHIHGIRQTWMSPWLPSDDWLFANLKKKFIGKNFFSNEVITITKTDYKAKDRFKVVPIEMLEIERRCEYFLWLLMEIIHI